MLGDAGLESAIAAMRAGAADYVEASAPAGEIAAIARRLVSERAIVSSLSSSQHPTSHVPELVGKSPKLRELRERVAQLATSDVTVLIYRQGKVAAVLKVGGDDLDLVSGGLHLRVSGWGHGIEQGDHLLINYDGQPHRYRVTEIEHHRDPADMWAADLVRTDGGEER